MAGPHRLQRGFRKGEARRNRQSEESGETRNVRAASPMHVARNRRTLRPVFSWRSGPNLL